MTDSIFRAFSCITTDCIVHIDNLSFLYPKTEFNREYLEALEFGWKNCCAKYQVVLVGECEDTMMVSPQVLYFFDYHCQVVLDPVSIQSRINAAIENKFSVEERAVIASRTSNFNHRDVEKLIRKIENQDLRRNELVPDIDYKKFTDHDIDVKHWKDFAGYSKVKKFLDQGIIKFFMDSLPFSRYNIPPSMGTLLYGPPGCGKTLLAKCVAGESNASFLALSVPDLVKGEVGESEKAIERVFIKARLSQPSIIFIDEIEALFTRNGVNQVQSKLSSQIVYELDSARADRVKLLLLAATNHIERVHPDLLRSGRIDRHIHLPLPDKKNCSEILAMLLGNSKIEFSLSLDFAAESMVGLAGSTIKEIVKQATMIALKRDPKAPTINIQDLIEARGWNVKI